MVFIFYLVCFFGCYEYDFVIKRCCIVLLHADKMKIWLCQDKKKLGYSKWESFCSAAMMLNKGHPVASAVVVMVHTGGVGLVRLKGAGLACDAVKQDGGPDECPDANGQDQWGSVKDKEEY